MLLQFTDQASTYDWTLGKVWLLYSVAGKVILANSVSHA